MFDSFVSLDLLLGEARLNPASKLLAFGGYSTEK
jgi:hypothetical protein